jgi:hypothetical protein
MAVGLSDTTIHTQARQSSRRGTIIQQKSLAFLLELALIFLEYFIKNSAVLKGRDSRTLYCFKL